MIYRFSSFEVDEENFCLLKDGERLPLEPKAFRVLLLLVKSDGRLLEKNAILDSVWKDTFVEETTLTRAVALLRKQLGDDPRYPTFIETVPTRGYRFIAAVQTQPSGAEQSAPAMSTALPVEPMPVAPLAAENELRRLSTTPVSPAPVNRRTFLWATAAAAVAAGGVWISRSMGRKRPQNVVNLVIPLPEGAGAADPGRLLGPPAIAPDGSAVVVSLHTAAGEYLFIRHLDTNRLVRMEGTQNGVQPFWSPDSQHIGFFADGKLKRIPVAGGSAIVLCDAPASRGGSWGRSGTIVFGINLQAIFQVAATGGRPTPVTRLDKAKGENSHRNPVFLPDGKRFFYFARTDDLDQRAIFLVSLEKPEERGRILAVDGQFALGRDPDAETYYLLSQQGGKIAVQAFDVDRGELAGTSAILLDRSGSISVSETGVLVVRTDQQTLTRLLWLDRAGKELGTLGTADDYWGISLSPDGRFAATTKHDYLSGQFRIWIASLESGLFEPLSDVTHTDTPLWSRDGTMIYYRDIRRRQLLRRSISLPAGEPDKVILDLPGDTIAVVEDISPDQRYAVAELGPDNAHSQVAWTELDPTLGTTPRWHFTGASGPTGLLPSLSPDGKWLAFASAQTGALEVYVMSFPGGSERRRVSLNGGHTPRWRRDGKELFFLSGDSSMMSVEFSASGVPASPNLLFHAVPRLGTDNAVYDVASDGRRFLLIDGENRAGESEIEMVLNWPSLLRH